MKKYFWISIGLTLPLVSFAQDITYKLVAPIPGGGDEVSTFTQYAEFVFPFMLSFAAVAALVMFVYGGIEYMTAGGGDRVNSARSKITSALGGLAIAVFSVLFLELINPELIKLDLSQISPIQGVPASEIEPGGSLEPGVGCTGIGSDCGTRGVCVEINPGSGSFQCLARGFVKPGADCFEDKQCAVGQCKTCPGGNFKRGLGCCNPETVDGCFGGLGTGKICSSF